METLLIFFGILFIIFWIFVLFEKPKKVTNLDLDYCQFCFAHKNNVKLIIGDTSSICDGCVDLCNKLIKDQQ